MGLVTLKEQFLVEPCTQAGFFFYFVFVFGKLKSLEERKNNSPCGEELDIGRTKLSCGFKG